MTTAKPKHILALLILIFSVKSFAGETPTSLTDIPSGLWRMGDGVYFSRNALIVDKSQKKIYAISNSPHGPLLAATYDSDLGKKPGDKVDFGDFRTPEGIYFFKKQLEGSSLDHYLYGQRAFVTDYPNFWDRTMKKRGSGIWLHAIDESQTLERGSRGCVVVRNDTIMKLSGFISLHLTPMIIYDKINWITSEANKTASEKVFKFLEKWKQSWQDRKINEYIGYYSDDFVGNRKMSKNQWLDYKKSLAEVRNDINVALSMPVIFEHKGNLIVRFLQDYKSAAHQDFGEKVLYLRRLPDDNFKIVGEEWEPATNATRSILASTNLCCSASN